MYHAGLAAQGSWDAMDQYDQDAILRFAHLIVEECYTVVVKSYQGHINPEIAKNGLYEHFRLEK